jgi:ATP-dependent DNA helicase RecG
VGRQIDRGRQVYVVCPFVDEATAASVNGAVPDEAREGSEREATAAVAEAERLRAGPLAGRRIGLLHGRLPSAEKAQTLNAFASGRLDVLVATTVVEVGVDVPNATVMVVEHADRFGLAQLHQLRGRVGRGDHAGACLLFADPKTDSAQARIEALLDETNDGFALADIDWRIRGEGQVLGARQSGAPDLRFADLREAVDRRELGPARAVATAILDADPRLESPEHSLLRLAVRERFADATEWLSSG